MAPLRARPPARGPVRVRAVWHRGLAGALLVLLLGALWAPAPAAAHATLVRTTPTDGGHLDRGPAEVVFTVNEAVSLVEGSAQVIDRDGTRHPIAGTELGADRTVVTVRLSAALPDGSYLATARLLSSDTHVVSVSAAFTVGAADGLLAPPPTRTGVVDRVASYAAKLAVYLGAILSAGVLVTTAALWPGLRTRRRWRRTVGLGSALLVAGLTARLVIEAAHRSDGLTRITGAAVGDVLASGFGVAAQAAVAATLVHHCLPGTGGVRRLRVVAAATSLATTTAVTLGGHGADPALFPLPLVLTLLHVLALLAWTGGVVVIAVELGRAVPLPAWHRYALVQVAVVAGTGVGLVLVRVPAPAALVGTAYGLALLLKVLLVVLVVVVAALVHRNLVRSGVGEVAPAERRGGVRFVGAELLLVAGVLGATGVLSSVVPATVSYDPPVRTTVDFGGGAVLAVSIPSTRRGPQELHVESPGGAGGGSPLSVDLSSREANVARLPVRFGAAAPTADGVRWVSRDLVVPVAGTWQVTLTYDTAAGPRVASFRYEVR